MLLFRSVSDPGPPLLLSRELKVPSYSSKVEPLDEMAAESNQQLHQLPNQQKVIEEFEKLVTQDTLDLVKVGDQVSSSVQQPLVTTVSSLPSDTGFLSLPSKRIIKASSVIEQQQQPGCRDRFVLNNGQYFSLSQNLAIVPFHR